MQITVKTVRVLKTGENAKGKWELIAVGSEDNTDYTTFDKKAKHLTSGAVIDIGEPTIKEGKAGFKEFTVISEGQPEIPGQQTGMTVKELGDMIRVAKLGEVFGVEVAVELVKWYRGQILSTTRIPYDGTKLPDFKKKEAKTE